MLIKGATYVSNQRDRLLEIYFVMLPSWYIRYIVTMLMVMYPILGSALIIDPINMTVLVELLVPPYRMEAMFPLDWFAPHQAC